MIINFSKEEIGLMYNILIRVKTKYEKDLSSQYNWIDKKTLDGLTSRFKSQINLHQIKEMGNA
jgi:hypothetical protein